MTKWKVNRDANAEARSKYLAIGTLYSLKHRYGVTAQDVLDLATAQNDSCAICKAPLRKGKGMKGTINVDHDHTSGEIRGLLCGSCNTGLGCFSDDSAKLSQALVYLKNPPAQSVLKSSKSLSNMRKKKR